MGGASLFALPLLRADRHARLNLPSPFMVRDAEPFTIIPVIAGTKDQPVTLEQMYDCARVVQTVKAAFELDTGRRIRVDARKA